MPKKKYQAGENEEQEVQNNILLDDGDRDIEDELEENVGVPPRKVTMEEFVGADEAFDKLVSSEEYEIEKTPFRPGKDTRFVLTDRQKAALEGCIEEFDKYYNYEIVRHHGEKETANQKFLKLYGAMKKIVEPGVGLDGLNPEERKAIEEFNDTMNTEYSGDRDTENDRNRNLIEHMYNYHGTMDLKMSKINRGLDMLGVMTGKTADYMGNMADDYKSGRAEARKKHVGNMFYSKPAEVKELTDTAGEAGLAGLRNKFKGTEIGRKLDQINAIVDDLKDYKYGNYSIGEHLKDADDLGTFLTKKGANGKTNYDTIAETILANKHGGEQKKAFDLLLGQLNTVCDLDIGVPYAIEAKAEYDWNHGQQKEVDATRIESLNQKLFGKDRTVHAYDKEFLDSVNVLQRMIKETLRNKIEERTENKTRMWQAHLGFEEIEDKVRNNSGYNKIKGSDPKYINVMDFGKTLQRKEGDKTLYELLAQTYESKGKTRADLDNTLEELNKRLDLKITIPGRKLEGEDVKPAKPEQSQPYLKKITEVQRSANRMDDPVQLKMALASVLALRRMSVDPAHQDHKKVRAKAAYAKAVALMETDAFKAMTKDMSVMDLAKKINHPGNFDKEFVNKIKEMDEAKYAERLNDKNFQKKFTATAKNASKKMDDTGTGVYFWGIKRGSNSGMYDRTVLAMQRAAKNPDAATTLQAVQTVKEYLSNKMTKRSSPSGQERWKNCMQFLHEAMPEDEFKAYCDQVNKVRKTKEGSPDFIEPDDFAPQVCRNSVSAEIGKKKTIDTEAAMDAEAETENNATEMSGRNSVM